MDAALNRREAHRAMVQALQTVLSKAGIQPRHDMTDEEWKRHLVDRMNSAPGALGDGIDCQKCLNRGYYYRYDEESSGPVMVNCDCRARRNARRRLDRSGLGSAMRRMTFRLTGRPDRRTA